MKLRLKFLSFIAIFLTGSFLIVTWKSYDIFSSKYVKTFQFMQLQDLEKQAGMLAAHFESLQSVLRERGNVEAQLKSRSISLLGHILHEEGKWKAQWFEGQSGLRAEAQSVAHQIPFDTLSTSKKSWHSVKIKDQGSYLAYVIPVFEKKKNNYYAFFFKKDVFNKAMKGAAFLENITLLNTQGNEIFSMGEGAADILEKNNELLQKKQSGVIALGKTNALGYYFHPDLQLFFVKTFSLQKLMVESASYLMALFAIIALLVGLSLLALDLMLKSLFVRVSAITRDLRVHQGVEPVAEGHRADELTELEMLVERCVQSPISDDLKKTAAEQAIMLDKVTAEKENLLNTLRPKAINSLGYLHRIKMESKIDSSKWVLLERELRDLRNLLEPMDSLNITNPILPNAIAPSPSLESVLASPLSAKSEPAKTSLIHGTSLKTTPTKPVTVAAKSDSFGNSLQVIHIEETENLPSVEETIESALLAIRKPKRERHESH